MQLRQSNTVVVEARSQRVKLLLLLAAFYLDVLLAALQYGVVTAWQSSAWLPTTFFSNLMAFSNSTADSVVLSIVRAVLVPLLLYLAIRVGSPITAVQELAKRKSNEKMSIKSNRRPIRLPGFVELDEEEPLIVEEDVETGINNNDKIVGSNGHTKKSDDEGVELTEKEKKAAKQAAEWKKNIYLALIFAILTLCEVHTGVKSIVFPFDSRLPSSFSFTFAATSIAASVFWMNMELFLSRSIADALTKDRGELFPQIHPHPLYYDDTLPGHMCNNCRSSELVVVDAEFARLSDCLDCTKTKSKARGEGLLRGDRGVVEEREFSDWEYMKKALGFARPHVPIVLLAFLMMLLSSGSQLLLPNYQGRILDHVIKGKYEAFVLDIKLFLGFTVAVGLFGGIRNICFNIVGQKMSNEIRNRLFSNVIIQDIAYFDGTTTGDLTSRLSQDTSAMVAPTRTLLSTFLSSTIYLIGGLIMCLYTSWRLSVLAFTTIGPIVLVYRVYSKWSKKINREIWAALGDASNVATQAIGNIRTVRAFGMEPHEEDEYKRATGEALDRGIKDAYASAGTYTLTNYIDLGISVLLLWYGGSVVMSSDGRLSIGNLITFQLYWGMINSAYSNLSDMVTQFTKAGGAAQRVLNLMEHLPDINPHVGKELVNFKGDIELKGVEFFYQMRPDEKVLKGVSLKIEGGKTLALVGRSGGGKSTLIHLLLRFYNPSNGSIFVDNVDLSELNPIKYRQNIGLVAQETQLFNSTIEENIAYGVDMYSQEELIDAAKNANAHEFIIKFEEGYKTRVGERGVRLSGGQKQRLAIARAFLRKPRLLFLDEATSSLDAESEGLVQDALDKLMRTAHCTVILVAHRLSTVISADKIAVIDKGVVVEQGRHEELVRQGGVYAALVSRQLARMQNTLEEGRDPSKEKVDVVDQLIEEAIENKEERKK